MEIENVRYDGASKFMWDGEVYDSRSDMETRKKEYENDAFEVMVHEQEGAYLLYTRRVVTEIVLDGPPPA